MTTRSFCTSLLAAALLALTLSGCETASQLMEPKKIDYKSAGRAPALDVPPDLTSPTVDDRFVVPDVNTSGSATFSVYNKERSGDVQVRSSDVLPSVEKVSFQRAGSERWITVRAKADDIWPVVKEFWQENGFIIKIEMPQAGVIETDWAENRAKIQQDFVRSILSKVADSLYSTAERDKFRTRLERGSEPDTTEIYISHRSMFEVYAGRDNSQTVWEPRPADPELEAEMLRRLMVRLGVQEARAKSMMAGEGSKQLRATLSKSTSDSKLEMLDAFDRAWRRIGLALDRIGFTVEDRDRSKGTYFVRYIDPETDGAKKDDKGFLGKLAFWKGGDSKKAAQEQYRILVVETSGGTKVNVQDKNGKPDNSETAIRILTLLYEQLK